MERFLKNTSLHHQGGVRSQVMSQLYGEGNPTNTQLGVTYHNVAVAADHCPPELDTLIRSIVSNSLSTRKMSLPFIIGVVTRFVSPGTSGDSVANTTNLHESLTIAEYASRVHWVQVEERLILSMIPVSISLIKTSPVPFVSPGTTSGLAAVKTTNLPSLEKYCACENAMFLCEIHHIICCQSWVSDTICVVLHTGMNCAKAILEKSSIVINQHMLIL